MRACLVPARVLGKKDAKKGSKLKPQKVHSSAKIVYYCPLHDRQPTTTNGAKHAMWGRLHASLVHALFAGLLLLSSSTVMYPELGRWEAFRPTRSRSKKAARVYSLPWRMLCKKRRLKPSTILTAVGHILRCLRIRPWTKFTFRNFHQNDVMKREPQRSRDTMEHKRERGSHTTERRWTASLELRHGLAERAIERSEGGGNR